MNLNPFEKDMFSKESENPTCWNVKSTGSFTLSGFWKGFENLDFVWVCYQPTQPGWFMISIDYFFKTLTELC